MLTHTWPVLPALWRLRQEIRAVQASFAYMAKALPQKQQTKSPLMYSGEAVEEEMAWSERCRRGDNVERDGRGNGKEEGEDTAEGTPQASQGPVDHAISRKCVIPFAWFSSVAEINFRHQVTIPCVCLPRNLRESIFACLVFRTPG